MESIFNKRSVCCYSNFMKYTISNAIYNIILIVLESSTILFIIDLMFDDKILGEAFTLLYFLSPHFYLDLINEQFPNECNSIFSNESSTNSTANATTQKDNFYLTFNNNSATYDIVFFGNRLYSLQNSFCIYSSNLIFIVFSILGLMTVFMAALFYIKSRGKMNIFIKGGLYVLTNGILLFTRPFFVVLSIVLINRPILFLYKSAFILSSFKSAEIAYTALSLIFLIYGIVFAYVIISFINNSFVFESIPYDYYSTGDCIVLLIIKVVIGLKINYDKLLGLNEMNIMNLIIGVLMFVRAYCIFNIREFVVNHVYLKNTSAFLSFFYCFYIIIKLLNISLKHLKAYTAINLAMELVLIVVILITLILILFKGKSQFIFRDSEHFMVESMQFMYYVSRNFNHLSYHRLNKTKVRREVFIDNVIIGHKMKCRMEDCIICCEDIYNPDLKTLCLILYQQFLQNEKEYKEKSEGQALLMKLMYIKMIDEKKIHRLSYLILKNLRNKNLSFSTLLKISYLYEKNLDELNQDLKGLLTIKYGEFNDNLLLCIKNFEDILGFIKSKTEKVELVTNKTNLIGKLYAQLTKDLFYLKRNKRIHFDPINFLQIICIVRIVFPRPLDIELTDNLEYSFNDFLEIIDHVFMDNISFLIRYDFNNKAWRMKKIPKVFIDVTKYKINELLDQSLETIFPKIISKNLIKKMEENIILSNMSDSRLEFKTVICDSETNARYVKFLIDIVPHLESSYMMFMQCSFHKRNLLIIDEFGHFINGSQVLYEKIGINAEIVSASKGRINMYTMFNLDKKQKLDNVTIVSIASEGVVDATKKLFLLEAEQGKDKGKQTSTPNFLDAFLKNEANGGLKKEKILVLLQLFSTETINNVKYYIYNLKLSNPDEKKKKAETTEEAKTSGARHTVTIKRIDTNYSNSSEEKELLHKETIKKEKKNDKKDDNNSSLNNFNYYYAFLDSQHSMSMTMNYKTNLDSYNSSQLNSTNSDVFSYLYMKTIGPKSHSNKFETFINAIVGFNLALIVYGLVSITYIRVISGNSLKLVGLIDDFFTMNSRVFKSTNVFFAFLKYKETESNDFYKEYIQQSIQIDIEYDQMIKSILSYDLSKALNDIGSFTSNAFNYFGEVTYSERFNYESLFIHLDPSGKYSVKMEKMKYIIDLFTLTLNQLSNKVDPKLLFNISYLEYEFTSEDYNSSSYMKITGINSSELNSTDKDYFTGLMNVFQHFFNYFNAFVVNFEDMKEFLHSSAVNHFKGLQTTSKALLSVILIINVAFVIICLSSIFIYQKILMTEFRALYGLSEDNIAKLKEKFQYVKELIKWEQSPSQIYNKIRKMREDMDQVQLEEKLKLKKKEEREAFARQSSLIQKEKTQKDDTLSVMTTGSTGATSDYLRFSGAVKGLFRSSTLRAKERLQKLSKETRMQKASQDLLNRLNFDFEMTKNFIFFIVFMVLFYIILGIVVIIINDANFSNLLTSLDFTYKFHDKYFSLFNFYSAVKLSIVLNQIAPYTIFNQTHTPSCNNCVYAYLEKYSLLSGELSNLGVNNKVFSKVYSTEKKLQGEALCQLYSTEYKSNLFDFLNERGPVDIIKALSAVCKATPLLNSNVDSIFNEIIVTIRRIYSVYLASSREIELRLNLLSRTFYQADILMTMFAHFYYEYICQAIVSSFTSSITLSFYNFLIVIFVVNIFIDGFMILFVWLKIYLQIITSVVNVQLLTDSVSII